MPEPLVLTVVQEFNTLSEQDIAGLEFGPASAPLSPADRHLLYALRVSHCVPRLTKLSTLASRWNVACSGAGGSGLNAAAGSEHWATIHDFLAGLYLARFDALADEAIRNAERSLRSKGHSVSALAQLDHAASAIRSCAAELAAGLPAVQERISRWMASLDLLRQPPEQAAQPEQRPQGLDQPEADRSQAQPQPTAKVEASLAHTPVVCFALEQVGTPMVTQVRLRNVGREGLSGLVFECSVEPDLVAPTRFPIPDMRPGEDTVIGPLDLRLPPGHLREVVEAERSRLLWRVADGDTDLAGGEYEIEILAYNEWPGSRSPAPLLACFVTPNHPVVTRILQRVRDRLLSDSGDGGISGYQTRSGKRVLEQVRALYATVQDLGITYIGLPASFEKQGQKVRLPDVVLEGQMGNCLDVSVLFAACLEQMGLSPLLVLVQGHAFPAVWMLDERFPEVVVHDAARLRNQIELNQILVFDSSTSVAAGHPGLEQAVLAARRYLTDDETFAFALDVRAARADRYRPLPVRMSVAQVAAGGDLRETDRALAEEILSESFQVPEPPPDDSAPPPPPATVDARFKVWKDRLLDLSLHNRLLNFRPGGGQAIGLDVPDLPRFEDLLAGGERLQVLPKAPSDAADQREQKLAVARDGDNERRQQLLADMFAKRIHAESAEAELFARARELARQAKNDLDEGGVITTYAAIGLLKWYESPSSEMARYAPLLLVPLNLEYEPRTQRVLMRRTEDDPVGNVTLAEKMHRDFAIDLSCLADLQADDSGIDVPALLRGVRAGIQRMPRWEVLEKVHIGHFTFAKFLMWKDLEENRLQLLDNPVVRHIAEGGKQPFPDVLGEVSAKEMDDTIPPAELPAVVDADSTQLAAVVSAVRGRSFVLEGPPGTGKSQTITNLIAAAIAAGKTVLFVSEKMAALEVVHRRLEAVGLGDFCLELHSNKANKKQVLESLRRAYERAKTTGDDDWQGRSARLQQVRSNLNAYSRALHHEHPLGMSVYRASARVLELKDAPKVGVPAYVGPMLSRDTFQDWLSRADALATPARRVEPVGSNPWRVSEITEWSSAGESRIEAALRVALEAVKEADGSAKELASACGVDAPTNADALDALAGAAACVSGGSVPRIAWQADSWKAIESRALEWIRLTEAQARDRAELQQRWLESFAAIDLDSLRALYARHVRSNALAAWFGLRRARRDLKPTAREKLPERSQTLKDIEMALACRERQQELDAHLATLVSAFGDSWGEHGSVASLRELLARCKSALRAGQILLGIGMSVPVRLIAEAEQPSPRTDLAKSSKRASAAAAVLRTALQDAGKVAFIERVLPGQSASGQLGASWRLLDDLRAGLPSLRNWCLYAKACAPLTEAGLGELVTAHREGRVRAGDLRRALERSVLEAWVVRARDQEAALREFSGDTHTEMVERFRQQDREQLSAARRAVITRVDARRPATLADASAGSEVGILLGQIRLQRRHMAIRKLFDRIPALLPKLKPCMLMSPLSVAQYLPATGRRFDLVVFDEASQIATHDAIGAIGRGDQVIVVGDSRQLPPTSFFQRNLDDDEAAVDDNDVVEMESVLDEACRVQIPRQWLGWHYRSRHDSLIDFSNRHYYENRLQVYASARWRADDLGVHWVHVPDGAYQLGKTRTNPREAERVVEALVAELRRWQPGKRSFGVVTFSVSQQSEVENRLEQARIAHPEIEGHFSDDLEEPVFVKNLENVQGDERDEILLSVCYGPDENGKLYMNFGPINRTGGERRLNVAITRARFALRVFSTLRHDQIDLARTNAVGARHLRAFLQYAAERGGPQEARPTAKAFDSEFERQVHDELILRGLEVDCQVGCAGYRIDLAVRHPGKAGTYALGVECDGAPYHSASTARDRDRLREQVLRGLGWTLHRVWSSDWWYDREREVEKLVAAVEAALARGSEAPAVVEVPVMAPAPEPGLAVAEQRINSTSAPAPTPVQGPPTTPYRRAELTMLRSGSGDMYSQGGGVELAARIEQVVRVEGPIHVDVIARTVSRCFEIGRVTERVRARIQAGLEALARQGKLVLVGDFAWPAGAVPEQWAAIRVPEAGDEPRELEHVPPEEIANAMRWHLSTSFSMPFKEMARASLRTLGYGSVTRRSEGRVRSALGLLIEAGEAGERDELIEWRGGSRG